MKADVRSGRGARRISELVSILDILPTVAGLTGFEIEGGEYPGRDLMKDLTPTPVFGFCWSESQCMAMIEGPWKFINHFGLEGDELFRLDLDPEERENLLEKEPVRAGRMKADADRWRDGVRSYYRSYYSKLLEARRTGEKPYLTTE
jgi:arylsulfatase A-like enzyme